MAPGESVDGIAALIRRAGRVGVAVHPLELSALTRPPSAGLVIGYGAIPTDQIEAGLDRLHRCLVSVR
jgi:GntR family transcriptional regulator / MocR family aminotransferase